VRGVACGRSHKPVERLPLKWRPVFSNSNSRKHSAPPKIERHTPELCGCAGRCARPRVVRLPASWRPLRSRVPKRAGARGPNYRRSNRNEGITMPRQSGHCVALVTPEASAWLAIGRWVALADAGACTQFLGGVCNHSDVRCLQPRTWRSQRGLAGCPTKLADSLITASEQVAYWSGQVRPWRSHLLPTASGCAPYPDGPRVAPCVVFAAPFQDPGSAHPMCFVCAKNSSLRR